MDNFVEIVHTSFHCFHNFVELCGFFCCKNRVIIFQVSLSLTTLSQRSHIIFHLTNYILEDRFVSKQLMVYNGISGLYLLNAIGHTCLSDSEMIQYSLL